MSATLDDLPPELLTQIFNYLNPGSDDEHTPHNIRDFYSICLTSRTLNAVATRFLYHTISTQDSAAPLRPFLRTVIENPQLAQHLKNINICHWYFLPIVAPTQSQLLRFKEAASPLSKLISFHRTISEALSEGSYEAVFILLLAVANQLENLTINIAPSELPTPDSPFS